MWRFKFHAFGMVFIIKARVLIITGIKSDTHAIILNW